MSTYIFPGQGSQVKGMGKAVFDEYRELTAQADAILGYSVKELCLEDPKETLGQTQYTQPALYVVNALSYLSKIATTGKPDYVAGHSLGEYDALFASGAFDFATGLKLVKKRGELMSHATGGGMAAIIGVTADKIAETLHQYNLQGIDMANFNTPSQIVISGLKADIEQALTVFSKIAGVQLCIPLKTSGAFHSRYMEAARQEFAAFISTFSFSELTIPVISNVHAQPYVQGEIQQNLIDQISHPVKWADSIKYLLAVGETDFVEVGPGNVLTGLVRKIKNELK